MKPRVAVVDVGSNSIKALVAEPGGTPHAVQAVYEQTMEVRISKGIGGQPPMLQPDRIEAGAEAVARLCEDCQRHGPLRELRIVATSAVRSAGNGHVFLEKVRARTGFTVELLSGSEEADGIARGVRTDPSITGALVDYTVFDLGGGSLELIRFERNTVTARTSLPLGSVRLTEQFVKDPAKPVAGAEQQAIAAHVRRSVEATGFSLRPPLVGCSGGLAALREVLARRQGLGFSEVPALLPRSFIDSLTRTVTAQDLAARISVSGLPARRADIFPAALITFQVLMEMAACDGILHSLHNLRYGIAWQLLRDDA